MAKERIVIEPKSLLDFKNTIDKFAEDAKADVEMIAREQMRLMCRDAMTFTPPLPKGGGRGLSASAHKAGMNKTGNDIRRIFIPMDAPEKGKKVFLRQVISAVKGTGPTGKSFLDFINLQATEANVRSMSPVLRKIMQDSDPRRAYAKAQNYLNKARADGSMRPVAGTTTNPRPIHEKYKGAVNGRWKKNQPIGGPQYMIPTTEMLNAYIHQRQLMVGRVKAGYAAALRQIPKSVSKKGVERNFGAYDAPWVDANINPADASFSQLIQGGSVYMAIVNMIGNINNVAKEANTENLVYGNRVRQMSITLERRELAAIKRANRRK